MATDEVRLAEPNVAYIGAGVTFKGEISVPDVIIVEGTVEGDVTARTVRIGVGGTIKGNVTANDADVHGTLCDRVEVKQFLLLRSTGRVEGQINCGEVQVEKGAVLAGDFTAAQGAKIEKPAKGESAKTEAAKAEAAAASLKLAAAE